MSGSERNWKADVNDHGSGCYVVNQMGKTIADVYERRAGITREQALNRARLFAAAPDLLAACKALREAALNLRGEVAVTGTMTAATLEPMFAADDLAQAAIAKAQEGT